MKRQKPNEGQRELFPDLERRPRRAKLPSPTTEKAIKRAVDHANQLWLDLGFMVGEHVAKQQELLTSADIDLVMMREHPLIKTHEKRAMAGIMRKLKSAKLIAPTSEFLPDPRNNCHSQNKRIWRSLIYGRTIATSA